VSSEPNDLLAQQLRTLRREYLADSTQRVEELREIRSRLARGERDALAKFRQAFHRLAGSGGSYGFPLVSTRSREGERLAQRLEATGAAVASADLAAFDACIDGVAAAFAEALRTLDTDRPQ
jgi:hypothetical protein